MADVAAALAALREATDAAATLFGPEEVAGLRDTADATAQRLHFLGPTVVAALVGGTGSGKSSLLNALAGEEVVRAGVLRPTTEQPTAWIPSSAEPELARLLETFGISRIVTHEHGGDLAIIDLPDLDSVELAHHATVDALLPRVDLVVWVLDPQKYNDRSLHERVAARARWAEQFVFVLNRSDTLAPGDLDAVRRDLDRSLHDDGIDVPLVITTAVPAGARPSGVDTLHLLLRNHVATKAVAVRKLEHDVADAAERLRDMTGIEDPRSDISAAWADAAEAAGRAAAEALVDRPAATVTERAGAREASRRGSGPLGRVWHTVRRSPVGRALGASAADPAARAERAEGPSGSAAEAAAHHVSRAITELSRDIGPLAGRHLRATFPIGRIDTLARDAVEAGRAVADPPTEASGWWWPAAAVVQTLATLAVLGGAVWWWADPTAVAPGTWPWPVLAVAAGLMVGVTLPIALRASGRRRGRARVHQRRDALTVAIGAQLDRRVGGPVRQLGTAHVSVQRSLAAVEAALR